MRAKVSDFGLSRQTEEDVTHVSSVAKGTVGYLDPEYYASQQLTEKSDVYSFGVVLFELLSGKKPVSAEDFGPELNIVHWARSLIRKGDVYGIIDPCIVDNVKIESIWRVAEVANQCVEQRGHNRPRMQEVIVAIQEAVRIERGNENGLKSSSSSSSKPQSSRKTLLTSFLEMESPDISRNSLAPAARFDLSQARSLIRKGDAYRIIDPCIVGNVKIESIWRVAELANQCVEQRRHNMPRMQEVIVAIQEAVRIERGNENGLKVIQFEQLKGAIISFEITFQEYRFVWLCYESIGQTKLQILTGLEYLHTGCNPSIIHRDVKSSNILLDINMRAKVSDFGLSRQTEEDVTHVSSVAKGTVGYLDPEYYASQQLTEKSDVYSFGVVLFELLSGKKPVSAEYFGPELNIVHWARSLIRKGDVYGIIDPCIVDNVKIESIWRVAEVANQCVEQRGHNRPRMQEVIVAIQEAVRIERGNENGLKSSSSSSSKAQSSRKTLLTSFLEMESPDISRNSLAPAARFDLSQARSLIRKGDVYGIIDPCIVGNVKIESIWRVAELANQCVEQRGHNRPRMQEVIVAIQEAVRIERGNENGLKVIEFEQLKGVIIS
ncbi:hypothetical protein F2Q70_00045056 [Brassica cretica]|uniref:Protein kinase domain-containing protein n=1 Tax=Brassica cretica TaxID=69181 RepID=A0A8S9KL55_BRACR|nr:hypothetical protein F2Q70_00045056 [Brassica cretica]